MSRVNASARRQIVRAAIAHAYDKKQAALSMRVQEKALEVYNFFVPKKVQEVIKTLPDKWVARTSEFNVNCSGQRIKLVMAATAPVPYLDRANRNVTYWEYELGAIQHGALCESVMALEADRAALAAERDTTKKQLEAMLAPINTYKAMLAAWPEGEPFYKGFMGAKPVQQVIQFDSINAKLGLPIE